MPSIFSSVEQIIADSSQCVSDKPKHVYVFVSVKKGKVLDRQFRTHIQAEKYLHELNADARRNEWEHPEWRIMTMHINNKK